MGSQGEDLAALLKPFHERAALAEDRLSKLEAQLESRGGQLGSQATTASPIKLQDLLDLKQKLEVAKVEQLAERKKAEEEIAASASEISKLMYQVVHLKRSLVEADCKIAELRKER